MDVEDLEVYKKLNMLLETYASRRLHHAL